MKVLIDDSGESTFRQDAGKVVSHLFAVYDQCTGQVVHVHRCVGDARFVEDSDTHSRMAMDIARGVGDAKHLRVLPVPAKVDLQGVVSLHVDTRSGQLKVSRADMTLEALAAILPKRGARRKKAVTRTAARKKTRR